MKKDFRNLPSCQHCSENWTYGETLKTLFRLRCPHCEQRNYQSRKFRWREPLFFFIVMIVNFVIFPFIGVSFSWKLLFIILLLIGYFFTLPFGLVLSKEEDSVF